MQKMNAFTQKHKYLLIDFRMKGLEHAGYCSFYSGFLFLCMSAEEIRRERIKNMCCCYKKDNITVNRCLLSWSNLLEKGSEKK